MPPEDPVLTSSRREALVVLVVWVVATAWSVGYCALAGYGRDPASLTFVLWFPDWVFWGIVAPWFVCIAISLWFALVFMRDEDLGSSADADADGDGLDRPEAEPGHE
ncbi:MAG: hypothetical protein HYX69_06140 [Planctomycetia bacterium]|nr:hypothetical protein [Planctomycetia bacterium]